MNYSWKGNIRELENAIEHSVIITSSHTITWDDIPSSLKDRIDEESRGTSISNDFTEIHRARDESSRKLFREAILQAKGDMAQAAKKLGMSRATLYRRLKKADMTGSISDMRRSINNEK